jgi:hypothetical protein
MRGDPVNPFQGVQHHASGAGARVLGRLQGQVAVIDFLQRIHGRGKFFVEQDRALGLAAGAKVSRAAT